MAAETPAVCIGTSCSHHRVSRLLLARLLPPGSELGSRCAHGDGGSGRGIDEHCPDGETFLTSGGGARAVQARPGHGAEGCVTYTHLKITGAFRVHNLRPLQHAVEHVEISDPIVTTEGQPSHA